MPIPWECNLWSMFKNAPGDMVDGSDFIRNRYMHIHPVHIAVKDVACVGCVWNALSIFVCDIYMAIACVRVCEHKVSAGYLDSVGVKTMSRWAVSGRYPVSGCLVSWEISHVRVSRQCLGILIASNLKKNVWKCPKGFQTWLGFQTVSRMCLYSAWVFRQCLDV